MLNNLLAIIQTYNQPACRELSLWLHQRQVQWVYGEQQYDIDVTKNRIVQQFLATNKEHLLCIANDMVPLATTEPILNEPGDLVYCESLASGGKLIHSGDYNFNAACFRVHRKVLELMKPPWFKMGATADRTQQTYCDCNHFIRTAIDAGFDCKSIGTIGHEQRMILIPDPEKPREKWKVIFPNQWQINPNNPTATENPK
jgi:hypothetical protein